MFGNLFAIDSNVRINSMEKFLKWFQGATIKIGHEKLIQICDNSLLMVKSLEISQNIQIALGYMDNI